MNSTSVYLDHSATTPVDPQVLQKMLPYFTEHFGNAASQTHAFGWKAKSAVDEARSWVAKILDAGPNEIYFTSGATESNNWVFFGLVSYLKENYPNEKIHFVSCLAEHASVVEPLQHLEKTGAISMTWLPLNKEGLVTIESIKQALRPETKLVSIMMGNNEIGALNPIKEIGEICKQSEVYFHSDATQVVGKLPTSVKEMNIDLLSFSGHKMYGPKGVGALYIRRKDPKVSIHPLLWGGGQEHGLRSGTVNTPLVVGLGEACRLALEDNFQVSKRLEKQAQFLFSEIRKLFPQARINGPTTNRIPGHLSLLLPGFDHLDMLGRLSGIALSTTSACSSGDMEMSHALEALGLTPQEAQCTYRLTLGKGTTQEDLDKTISVFRQIAK